MGLVVLRYAEIALKGGNRHEFLRCLRRNVRLCLRQNGIVGHVESVGERIYVHTDDVERALPPLSRVFGVQSLSPVREVARDIDAIVAGALVEAREVALGMGRTFRVKARRVGKSFPLTSLEIDIRVAEALQATLGARVDLSRQADLTLGIEVAETCALLYTRSLPGPGGLPVGSEGRVVALISGGIDSPVAAWAMMKRGCGIIPVHFAQNDVETSKALDNLVRLARYSYGWEIIPSVFDHAQVVGPVQERLAEIGESRWGCVFCKRAMLAAACDVAGQYGALAVVVGDSLGQVASQSLHNMAAISAGCPLPIVRPLVGMDKMQIVALAREIGTFEISTRAQRACAFLPANPVTRAPLARFNEIAARVETAPGRARPRSSA